MKIVYVIVEGKEKNHWKPCGVAFENKDGSLNVKLDLFPNVTLQVRDRKENNESKRSD